jgi:hypothetical protein
MLEYGHELARLNSGSEGLLCQKSVVMMSRTMEFNFTAKRVLVFLIFFGVFAALGGFSDPSWAGGKRMGDLTRPWIYCIALFGSGAVSASFVDHWAGLIDRSNLRWLYIILGLLAMGSSLVWLHVLRSSVEIS